MPFRPSLLLVAVAFVTVAACGGSQSTDGGGISAGESANPAELDDGSGVPPDVCALLSPTLAAEVLGSTEAPTTASEPGDDDAPITSAWCAYGSITDATGGLTVQVVRSTAGVDPFTPLIPDGTTAEELVRPPGAVRHAIGLVPGGGGIGSTVLFEQDELRVAVSVAGIDAAEVDTAGLERAAATVHAQLERP